MRLYELRGPTLRHIRQTFPNMPEYVARDLVYAAAKDDPSVLTDKAWKDWLGSLQWKKAILHVRPDIFDRETQSRLQQRKGGSPAAFHVRNDQERHAKQKELLAKGPSAEPIIVIKNADGYELVEGWHRTIQSLEAWPAGYKQPAWVGYK
jgi:hypothetical protein